MNEQQNTKLVQQGYEMFGRGDIQALLALFSEDIEWRALTVEGAPFAREYRGRDEVARFFAELDEAEEFTRFEPREFIAQGDRVAVLGFFAAKVKATGRNYETDWVHLYKVRNGKITEFREYADTAAALKAYQKAGNAVPV